MYTLVRRFIKTAVLFLAAGLALGSYMLIRRELLGVWPSPYLATAHTHALFIGFVMFLILGVALWLFPRPQKDDPRYRPWRIEAAYWMLLVATSARFIAEIARASSDARALKWIVVAAGLGQALGLLLYFWTMWHRIRPVGSQLREAAGERF